MTTVTQPPVTGQDINLAARATRKALEVLLAEQGASFQPLATLNSIAARGATLDAEALVRNLANAFDVDSQTVHSVLHGLQARGLVRQTPSHADSQSHFELTADGAQELQRLNAIVGQLTAKLYRDFDPQELATTRQVLVTLTERAEAYVDTALS
jgi:DNA-binding MarR family transcriptional regulator